MDKKAEVISLGGDLPVNQVLEKANEQDFDYVMVIGWLKEPDEDGNRFWVSSNNMNDSQCIYALQHANLKILELSRG